MIILKKINKKGEKNMKAKLFNYGTDEPLIIQFEEYEEETCGEEEKTLFERLKINDILFQYCIDNKEKKDLIVYKVSDIDENTVYASIIFSSMLYYNVFYWSKEEINDLANNFYLLSDLSEKDIEEIKDIIFNKILGIK